MKPLLFFPSLLLFTGATHAAVLATYDFDAADFTGNNQNATVSGTGLATVSTVSNLTFGAGIIEPKNAGQSKTDVLFIDISGQNGGAGNINNTTLNAAFSANDYFQFTVNAVGSNLNFQSLTFDLENSGGTAGGDGIHLFTSVDGFAAATNVVSSLTVPTGFAFGESGFTNRSFNLSASKFQNLGSITFRLYLEDAGGTSTGVGMIFDNLNVNGSAVPEPSTALLGALGVLGLLRRRR